MPRQQGLASVASIRPDLPERSTDPGHIQALRRNRRTFTLADQVDRLVGAREATPDRGFLARTMALCSLPRTNPGNRHRYVRRNPRTLVRITPASATPTATIAIISPLMFSSNPFGPFSHAP